MTAGDDLKCPWGVRELESDLTLRLVEKNMDPLGRRWAETFGGTCACTWLMCLICPSRQSVAPHLTKHTPPDLHKRTSVSSVSSVSPTPARTVHTTTRRHRTCRHILTHDDGTHTPHLPNASGQAG